MENEKQVSAWSSTTQAENTEKKRPKLCVDWVTASFRTAINLQQIALFFGISELENLEEIPGARYGFAGYDYTYRIGKIEFMHKSNTDDWLINLSGQGCREYEMLSGYTFETFFALMTHFYPVYTRIDIAIDDYENIFNVKTIRNACKNNQIVTQLKEYGDYKKGLINSPKTLTMDSFYLGSRNGRYFINIYDKKLEREQKGEEVDYKTWTRLEIRFSKEYAIQIVENIIRSSETLGDLVFQFLNQKIAILKKNVAQTTKNKSRSAQDYDNHARWWRTYLNTIKKCNLTVYKPDLPLITSKAWLLDKVSCTLALFKMYLNEQEYNHLLLEIQRTGLEKLDKQHLKRLEHQIMIDNAIKDNNVTTEWKTEVLNPGLNKIEKAKKTKEEKREYKQNIMDIYWNKVGEQQKREKEKSLQTSGNENVDS